MPLPPARAILVHVSGSRALVVTRSGLNCCEVTELLGWYQLSFCSAELLESWFVCSMELFCKLWY